MSTPTVPKCYLRLWLTQLYLSRSGGLTRDPDEMQPFNRGEAMDRARRLMETRGLRFMPEEWDDKPRECSVLRKQSESWKARVCLEGGGPLDGAIIWAYPHDTHYRHICPHKDECWHAYWVAKRGDHGVPLTMTYLGIKTTAELEAMREQGSGGVQL